MLDELPDGAFRELVLSRLDCAVDSLSRVSDSIDVNWHTPTSILYSLSQMKHVANYCETISRQLIIASRLFSGDSLRKALNTLQCQREHSAQEIAAIAAIQGHVRAWQSRN